MRSVALTEQGERLRASTGAPAHLAGLLSGKALAWPAVMTPRLRANTAASFMEDEAVAMRAPSVEKNLDMAVVEVKGALVHDADFWDLLFGAIDSGALADTFDTLAKDPTVRRVAVKFNCPGGDVRGMTRAASALAKLSAVKPTLAVIDGLAASGGYWLASQCREISAAPLSDIGSIGVIMGPIIDDTAFWADMGIRWLYVTTGEHKALGATGQPISQANVEMLRALLRPAMDAFVGAIVRGRGGKVTAEGLIALNAAIVKDAQAREIGLIDAIEEVPDALARFARGEAAAATASTAPTTATNTDPGAAQAYDDDTDKDDSTPPPNDSPDQAPDAPDDDEEEVGATSDKHGDQAMPDEKNSAPTPTPTLKPATLAELKGLNASAEFCLAALEKNMTLEQAQLSWSMIEASAKKAAPAPAAPGGANLTASVRGQQGLPNQGAASSDYAQRVAEIMTADTQIAFAAACSLAAERFPDAHAAWINAGCPAVANPDARRGSHKLFGQLRPVQIG